CWAYVGFLCFASPTELLPGEEETIALWITSTKINAESKAKTHVAWGKCVLVSSAAASQPRQRPRTALRDMGNKATTYFGQIPDGNMLDYNMLHFPLSQITAGAFCLAILTLQHYLSYTEEFLLIMQHLTMHIVMLNHGLIGEYQEQPHLS
ncbi:G2/mitotic-specific cyclin-B1, partial [Galemys pyrenaicus]